ncbi:MAG: hypothetical protein GF346_03805 [Candidatus Eisenbacteria bacterium]|nr:hypothetical protein [Candidatus Latescibacterota bacterium]MBD3301549.1 hypothetical protein [Candidatus Eisenbacteria bacterium]
MLHFVLRPFAAAALALLVAASGCGNDDSSEPTSSDPSGEEVVADFAVVDVNPNSSTHEEVVSPRQFLEQISAWYFGHAT